MMVHDSPPERTFTPENGCSVRHSPRQERSPASMPALPAMVVLFVATVLR